MQASSKSVLSVSIRSRLLIVTLLFLANALALEGLSTYIDSRATLALRDSSGKVDHQSGELAALAGRINAVVRQFKL